MTRDEYEKKMDRMEATLDRIDRNVQAALFVAAFLFVLVLVLLVTT
jgi:hypothetical protein